MSGGGGLGFGSVHRPDRQHRRATQVPSIIYGGAKSAPSPRPVGNAVVADATASYTGPQVSLCLVWPAMSTDH